MKELPHQPEHMRPGNMPSWWTSAFPPTGNIHPDPDHLARVEARADERDRAHDIAMVGRRLNSADRLGG